jgi:hypothetical protein
MAQAVNQTVTKQTGEKNDKQRCLRVDKPL